MKWNPDTGSFEVEREGESEPLTPESEKIVPRVPAPATPPHTNTLSPDDYDVVHDCPLHIEYDSPGFPRTIPEAEARILAALAVECLGRDLLHEPPLSAYQMWTEAQRKRFRKAEVNVMRRLIRLAGKKWPVPLRDTDNDRSD